MTIDPSLVNVLDLTIRRPNRTGPGGDTNPAEDLVIAARLHAIYEQVDRVVNTLSGQDITIEGIYHINPCDARGNPIDVRVRDYVEHTDLSGRRLQRKAIHYVSHWTLRPVDHIELEVARGGAAPA